MLISVCRYHTCERGFARLAGRLLFRPSPDDIRFSILVIHDSWTALVTVSRVENINRERIVLSAAESPQVEKKVEGVCCKRVAMFASVQKQSEFAAFPLLWCCCCFAQPLQLAGGGLWRPERQSMAPTH